MAPQAFAATKNLAVALLRRVGWDNIAEQETDLKALACYGLLLRDVPADPADGRIPGLRLALRSLGERRWPE